MQNTIGKLIKKIITRKISLHLEHHHLLPPTLGGYRPNRETWSNAATFAQDVYEGFHDGVETCAAIIDLEDAFNRVSYEFLLDQLSQLNICPFLVCWISALLYSKMAFRCDNWISDILIIHTGLPQGFPL